MIFGRINESLTIKWIYYPNENYLQRNTLLCKPLEILKQIHNFSNQVSAQSESQYLLHNQRKSAFMLS